MTKATREKLKAASEWAEMAIGVAGALVENAEPWQRIKERVRRASSRLRAGRR